MDIPKDQFSSGQRDMDCWAKVYGTTEGEAMAKAKKYLSCYPVRGYNTEIAWKGQLENGAYMVHLKRWHSCD